MDGLYKWVFVYDCDNY